MTEMLFSKKRRKELDESSNLIVMNKPSSIVSERFRSVRTNIQVTMNQQTLKTIIVTSADRFSGKSTVASNLALCFATQGKKVLLVDADLRSPAIHELYNVRNNDGLSKLLTDKESTLGETIYHNHFEGLSLLTSGVLPSNPAELLSSDRMLELIKEMEWKFDFIIFDMPPVLTVADVQVLSLVTDGVLFVIAKGKDNKEEVTQAKEILSNVQANVIGAILNKTDRPEVKSFK